MDYITEEQKEIIENLTNAQIDLLYMAVADEFELEYGDVSPNHVFEMDDLKDKIVNLMTNYVLVNK